MQIKLVIGDYCFILVLTVLFMTVGAEPSTTRRAKRRSAIIPEPAARHWIDCRSSFDILIV
ncbi:hypothetical protein Scep_001071 [Stephania cephalantha]|uniref:Uncharacterized protein n=1 Tax=Stephania cephalantha TaxID=152367 RepID=A0AAP0Q3G8_9MAGN